MGLAQFLFQYLVHQLWVGLALGGLHDLADEESEELVLSLLICLHLVRMVLQNLRHRL